MTLVDRLASLALVIADLNARLSEAEHERDVAQQRVAELEALAQPPAQK